jgi:DNA polymerase-3 subunit delta'
VLILTAETTEMLLPTIVSRCEVLRLRPLSFTSLEKSLQDKWNFDSEKAFFLSRISNGCPGLARRFSEMPELLERRAAWMKDFYEIILDTNRIQRFTYADRITKDKDKEKMRTILHTWISFWRDVILLVNGCSSQLANPDFFEQISNISSHLEPERARQVLVNLLRTLDLLQHNINYKLAFEVLMLDLPILSKSPIIGK